MLVISHVMPDADTLGSALGLAWALRARGIEVRLSCADPLPERLLFLPGSEGFAARTRSDEELVIAVDCSDIERLGPIHDLVHLTQVPLINIDHHVTNTHFGDAHLVVERSSTAELIYELLCYLGIPLDVPVATCLLAGLVSDTRSFRTSNTTADSLRTAVALVKAGASLPWVADALFNHRSRYILPLWGEAFARAQSEDGLLWTEVSQEMLSRAGADPTASSGLVNFISTLDGVQVAVVFCEIGGGIVDVGFRSRPGIDVSRVALALGGGGHPQASGCQVKGSLEEVKARVLAALREMLPEASERPIASPV